MDALIAKHNMTDPAVLKMADILRAADINSLRGTVAESEGVRAIVYGFFLLNLPDGEALTLQLPAFDALYRYCQELVSRQRWRRLRRREGDNVRAVDDP